MLFAPRGRAKMSAVVLTLAATPALAESPAPAPQASADAGTTSITLDTIEIISQELNAARLQIQPSLGASTYYFGSEALETIPQGENAPLNQVLLQMPGVAQDSFGQIHVRGEHANVQFRINGVQLPEGLSVFGQALETRFARSISLLTGALPAQYGFFTAGVLDIQTKTGLTNPGLALTMYGGSFNWLQPSFEYGGHEGPVDWFFTGDYLSNERGIENPAPTYNAIHDATQQIHGFSYMSGIIDPDTRVSVLGGAFDGRFQIPNNPGQIPSLGLNVLGVTSFQQQRPQRGSARVKPIRRAVAAKTCRRYRYANLGLCPQQRSVLQPGRDRRSSVQWSDPFRAAVRSRGRRSGRRQLADQR